MTAREQERAMVLTTIFRAGCRCLTERARWGCRSVTCGACGPLSPGRVRRASSTATGGGHRRAGSIQSGAPGSSSFVKHTATSTTATSPSCSPRARDRDRAGGPARDPPRGRHPEPRPATLTAVTQSAGTGGGPRAPSSSSTGAVTPGSRIGVLRSPWSGDRSHDRPRPGRRLPRPERCRRLSHDPAAHHRDMRHPGRDLSRSGRCVRADQPPPARQTSRPRRTR